MPTVWHRAVAFLALRRRKPAGSSRPEREPLERAVVAARMLLIHAAEAGRSIPDITIGPILETEASLKTGGVSVDVERAFYSAYSDLTTLTADISKRTRDYIESPFEDAVSDSEQLLRYASERGIITSVATVSGILGARTALAANSVTDHDRSAFYSAYSDLSRMFGDVTSETIRNCEAPETKRSLARDRIVAIVITTIVASVSVVTFVTDSMSKKILEDIGIANDLAATLRVAIAPPGTTSKINEKYTHEDPCDLQSFPSHEEVDDHLSVIDVSRLQDFAATIRDLRNRSDKLNEMLRYITFRYLECDPYGACGDEKHDKNLIQDETKLNSYLQIDPAILNYTAEVLCKIKTYQVIRTFSTNVQSDYAAIIGAVISYALPIFYALLGAYAYRLRLFAETIKKRTYHPSFSDSARMITAVIAGAICGLFNPAQGLTLSPLATAFLVGYGVELFFKLLDTMIGAFGSAASQGPRVS